MAEKADKGKTGLGRTDILDFSIIPDMPVNRFEAKRGNGDINTIDIIPFEITESWYKNLRMPSGRPTGLDVGDLDYKLQVPVHRGMGPDNRDTWLCLREAFGRECYRCNEMFDRYKEGDKEEGKKLRPSWLTFYNVYDYDDDAKGWQLWKIAYYNFEATTTMEPQRANLIDAQMLSDGGVVLFSDLEEGSTILAKFQTKILGKTEFGVVFDINFEARDPYEESVLQEVFPLDKMLIIPTSEDVKRAHLCLDADEDVADPKPSSLTTPEKRKRTPPLKKETPKKEAPKDESLQCPDGGEWGTDCNQRDACQGGENSPCTEEIFEECLAAYESIEIEEQEPEPEPEPEQKAGGRRRRR